MNTFSDTANLDEIRQGADLGGDASGRLFLHSPTGRRLTGILKDWEKAREVRGDILEPAGARKTKP